jgi:ribosome maturation factor RimP
MDLRKIIEESIAETLEHGFFVVDLQIKTLKEATKITVLLDGDAGVGIDTCVSVSRHVSARLDDIDEIAEKYSIDVSSPGVDFPLRFVRQYAQHIGRTLKISLKDATNIEGKLLDFEQETQTLSIQNIIKKKVQPSIIIPFDAIKEASVVVSFK